MEQTSTVELTCVCCPMGCQLVVERQAGKPARYVSGAGCARGVRYAPEEATCPMRVVTTTVLVDGCAEPLSVRTAGPVPRSLMPQVVKAAKGLAAGLSAPIEAGRILCPDICATGVALVATKSVIRQ